MFYIINSPEVLGMYLIFICIFITVQHYNWSKMLDTSFNIQLSEMKALVHPVHNSLTIQVFRCLSNPFTRCTRYVFDFLLYFYKCLALRILDTQTPWSKMLNTVSTRVRSHNTLTTTFFKYLKIINSPVVLDMHLIFIVF